MGDNISILFGNWLCARFTPDDGIGYWVDVVDDDKVYTTEELWDKFNRAEVRKLKIQKIIK